MSLAGPLFARFTSIDRANLAASYLQNLCTSVRPIPEVELFFKMPRCGLPFPDIRCACKVMSYQTRLGAEIHSAHPNVCYSLDRTGSQLPQLSFAVQPPSGMLCMDHPDQ